LVTTQSGPDNDPGQRRLDDLGRRIDAARDQQPESKPAQPSSAGAAYRLASELIAGLLVGVLMGWGFDALFGTRPWGLMVFLILGLTAAMINVIRSAQKMNAAASEAKEREK
jgi:ATP synthase protein I